MQTPYAGGSRAMYRIEAMYWVQGMDERQLTNVVWSLASLGETHRTTKLFALVFNQLPTVSFRNQGFPD